MFLALSFSVLKIAWLLLRKQIPSSCENGFVNKMGILLGIKVLWIFVVLIGMLASSRAIQCYHCGTPDSVLSILISRQT